MFINPSICPPTYQYSKRTDICMYVRMYVCMCVCVYRFVHIYIYMYMFEHLYVCMYIYICMYVCMYVHLYIHTYIYIHTYGISRERYCSHSVVSLGARAAGPWTSSRVPPSRYLDCIFLGLRVERLGLGFRDWV